MTGLLIVATVFVVLVIVCVGVAAYDLAKLSQREEE